jgi:putative flippase GtrA
MEIGHFPWPTIASAIGSIFGISVSYFGNYSWTFARTEPHKMFVVRFVTTYALSMAAHTGMMFAQIDGLGFHYPLAFVLATILSTLLNFGVAKVAVFERDHYRRHAIFPNRGSSSVS